jgi:hypothetical protein
VWLGHSINLGVNRPNLSEDKTMFDRDTKELLVGFSTILIFALALTFLQPVAASWFQN